MINVKELSEQSKLIVKFNKEKSQIQCGYKKLINHMMIPVIVKITYNQISKKITELHKKVNNNITEIHINNKQDVEDIAKNKTIENELRNMLFDVFRHGIVLKK